MLPLFLTTCAIVVGLGMVIPLLPFYAARFGASPAEVALLFAIYSACQFIAAPLWGRISDRVGRKPVLLVCYAGTAATYVWLAQVGSLAEMFASRAAAGAMAGWLATGQAWVADSTDAHGRARGMGLLGAAFGIGFVIGPALGAVAVGGEAPNFSLPILMSAAASGMALIIGAILVPEPVRHVVREGELAPTALRVLAMPLILLLLAVYFIGYFVFSGMESVLALWADRMLGLGPRDVGLLLAFAGVCMVVVQGGLVGRLVRRFGEERLILTGLVALAAGLLAIPPSASAVMMMPALALLALGQGIANPSLQSLVSRAVPASWRGGTMGALQSANSMGRILGPVWAGFAFSALGPDWPFVSGAFLLLPAVVIAVFAGRLSRRRVD